MAQTSPAKVKVTGINQIAFVVKDLEESIEAYWNILGIGPWDIYVFETPMVHYYEYHGKPAYARSKVALTSVGSAQLELIEHLDGDTIFRDFLAEHEEGLHHLSFLVEDVDKTVKTLVKDGFDCLQMARFGDNGTHAYMDMKPLHAIWEVVHEANNMGVQPTRYPDTE